MSEVEKRVQEKLEKAIPQMNEKQKSYLLGYGEAVLDMHQDKVNGADSSQKLVNSNRK